MDTTVFARPLHIVMNKQKLRNNTLKIPEFVDNAIRALILKGITDGTLFTTATPDKESMETLMNMKNQLNKGTHYITAVTYMSTGELVDFVKCSPKIVAFLLRLFLKQLPEPLFLRSMINPGTPLPRSS